MVIDAYEVPPEADAEFLAAWDGSGTMHRALRRDVRLRFVRVARDDPPEADVPPTRGDTPGADLPFAGHRGVYQVAHEDGDVDGAGGVILINAFEVEPADDDRFLAGWHAARDVAAAQRGYLGTRLHRAVGEADHRFVNIARWSSPLMFFRATQLPAFQSATGAMPFPSHPGLFEIVNA